MGFLAPRESYFCGAQILGNLSITTIYLASVAGVIVGGGTRKSKIS